MVVAPAAAKSTVGSLSAAIGTGDEGDGCVGFLRAASTSSHVGGSVESNGPVKLKSNFPDFPSRGAKKSGSGAGLNTERGRGVGSGSPFRVIEDKSGMTRINVFFLLDFLRPGFGGISHTDVPHFPQYRGLPSGRFTASRRFGVNN